MLPVIWHYLVRGKSSIFQGISYFSFTEPDRFKCSSIMKGITTNITKYFVLADPIKERFTTHGPSPHLPIRQNNVKLFQAHGSHEYHLR
jgi:hypothetical protein